MNRPLLVSPRPRVPASCSLALLPLRRYLAASLRRSLPFVLSTFCFCVFASGTFAQSPDLGNLLGSDDPAQHKQAVTLLREQVTRAGQSLDPSQARQWLRMVYDAKLPAEAGELAQHMLPTFTGRDNSMVALLTAYKAAAALSAGQKTEMVNFLKQGARIDPWGAIGSLETLRLPDVLTHAGLQNECLEAIDRLTIMQAGDVDCLERLLTLRAQTFLAAGRPLDALACAKSLFNVSTMDHTARSLTTLAQCVQAAYSDRPEITVQFRQQQSAGAAPTTRPAKSAVFAQIKVDAAQYEKAVGPQLLPSPVEEDYAKLFRGGNLLLLADRPADAKLWFEQAYRICNNDQLAQATESLARTIKAEDGTIGRANAFALSVRPAKPAAK